MTDADLCHDGDRDTILNLGDLLNRSHAGDAAFYTDVGRHTLEGHDRGSAGILGDLGLVGVGDIENHPALEHLRQSNLDTKSVFGTFHHDLRGRTRSRGHCTQRNVIWDGWLWVGRASQPKKRHGVDHNMGRGRGGVTPEMEEPAEEKPTEEGKDRPEPELFVGNEMQDRKENGRRHETDDRLEERPQQGFFGESGDQRNGDGIGRCPPRDHLPLPTLETFEGRHLVEQPQQANAGDPCRDTDCERNERRGFRRQRLEEIPFTERKADHRDQGEYAFLVDQGHCADLGWVSHRRDHPRRDQLAASGSWVSGS